MSSLSATLDSAWMNADPTSPPHARAAGRGEATVQKSKGVVLPSAREMGLRAKPVISTPQYEPKQWGGVSALAGEEVEFQSSFKSGAPSPNAILNTATKGDVVGAQKKNEVPSVLPAHELARKARMSKDESYKGDPNATTASWTGISGSLVDAQRPSPEHRRRTSLEPPASAPGNKPEPQPSTSPNGIRIPNSRELAGSSTVRAPAPNTLRPNSRPLAEAGSPNWLGIARFSSMSSITYSPSPPKRRSASKSTENQEELETTPKRVSLPSSLDLGILPKQSSKTVFTNRSNKLHAGYASINHNWSGVSAVLVD